MDLRKRLGHVVVGAKTEAAKPVLDAGSAGQDHDRGVNPGQAESAEHFISGHVWKPEVKKDDIIIREAAEVGAFFTDVGGVGVEPLHLRYKLNALSRP